MKPWLTQCQTPLKCPESGPGMSKLACSLECPQVRTRDLAREHLWRNRAIISNWRGSGRRIHHNHLIVGRGYLYPGQPVDKIGRGLNSVTRSGHGASQLQMNRASRLWAGAQSKAR